MSLPIQVSVSVAAVDQCPIYAMPRHHPHEHNATDHGGDDEDESPIYTTRRARSALELQPPATTSTRFAAHLPRATGLSALLGESVGWRKPKIIQITTAPGQLGAGETETEADEPVSTRMTSFPSCHPRSLKRHFYLRFYSAKPPSDDPHHACFRTFGPTQRRDHVALRILPPLVRRPRGIRYIGQRLVFVVSTRLLVHVRPLGSHPRANPSMGPAMSARQGRLFHRHPVGTSPHFLVHVILPHPIHAGIAHAHTPQALLTAHQCLKLTTGLLHRWRAYYSPLSTLIRLLALQAICWPATHFTLDIVGSLGTNTALGDARVTVLESALLRWTTARPDICWAVIGTTTCVSRSIQIWVTSNLLLSTSSGTRTHPTSAVPDRPRPRRSIGGEETRKLTGRKWDWGIVGRKCMLPAGCLYVVMAWIGAWRREARGC